MKKFIEEASAGGRIVLVYPDYRQLKHEFRNPPRECVVRLTASTWHWEGTGGFVKFMVIDTYGADRIRGWDARVVFRGKFRHISEMSRLIAKLLTSRYEQRFKKTAYYKEHTACPECGSMDVACTLVGYVAPPDLNKATCSCGWIGVVDNLVQVLNKPKEEGDDI